MTKESKFVGKEREVIEGLLDKTDDFLVDLTFKYFNNLKSLKEIEREKRIYIGKKLSLQKKLVKESEEILKFSSMLYFESNKAISIKKISKINTQYSRCENALKDNSIKDSKFSFVWKVVM